MAQAEVSPQDSFYVPRPSRELIQIGAIGLVSALITMLLSELIARFFIEPVFCSDVTTFAICSNGGVIAFYFATVLGAIMATIALARLLIFRPLPIIVMASAAMWGIKPYIDQGAWWEYGLWTVGLFIISYLLFYWLFRLKSFVVSLVLSLIAVVIIRLVLHS